MNLDLFKRIFGAKLIDDVTKELEAIKTEWNRRHKQHFEDHRRIGELLGEVLKKLDEIEKKIKS